MEGEKYFSPEKKESGKILNSEEVLDILEKAGVETQQIDEALKNGKVDFLSKISGIRNVPEVSVSGIGFREEKNGKKIINYYFEDAIGMFVKLIADKRSFLMDFFLKENNKRILNIVLTEDGQKMIRNDELSLDQLRTDILSPELFHAEKIGSGSECNVYKYPIGKKELAVKILDEEAQKRVDEIGKLFRTHYPKPDLSSRVGFAETIIKELEDFPRKRYDLSALTEYAASQKYIITDIGPQISVEDIVATTGIKEIPKKMERFSASDEFMKKNNISIEDVKELYNELMLLEDIGLILKYCNIGSFKGSCVHDFSLGNFLIKDFDSSNGRFNLVLIDQGQEASFSDHNDMKAGFDFMYAENAYKKIMAYPELASYLKSRGVKKIELPF